MYTRNTLKRKWVLLEGIGWKSLRQSMIPVSIGSYLGTPSSHPLRGREREGEEREETDRHHDHSCRNTGQSL